MALDDEFFKQPDPHDSMKIGYARISTKDQNLDLQIDALVNAGCEKIYREIASGAKSDRPALNELIQKTAVSASCDRRFNAVRKKELDKMELEISVLSPLKKISLPEEIILGKHGIYIRKGLNSGTFLPQVANKTGWNLDEFLGHCSRDKAGLGWDGWKTAELFTYEAVIFRG